MRTRVLIADDNAFVRTALYEFFDREPDFQVCALAENGKEAIEAASRRHPDLVVLDRTMPVMSGLDAARVLKNIMPRVLKFGTANQRHPSHSQRFFSAQFNKRK